MWKYPTGQFHINKHNLLLGLDQLKGNKKKQNNGNKYVVLSFDSITKDLTLFLENQMIEITLYHKTGKLKKIKYVDDLQQLRVKKCKKKLFLQKEARFMENWLSFFVDG